MSSTSALWVFVGSVSSFVQRPASAFIALSLLTIRDHLPFISSSSSEQVFPGPRPLWRHTTHPSPPGRSAGTWTSRPGHARLQPPRRPSRPSLRLPSLPHSRVGPLIIIKSVSLGCSGRIKINSITRITDFLFPFTSDNPRDELMKWKEELQGVLSARSRLVLL